MLRLMLLCHSRLAIPPETGFLIPLVKQFRIDRALSRDEVESAVSIMTSQFRWPDMKFDVQEFRRQVNQLEKPSVCELAAVVYRWHMEAEGKVRWGDKTPHYIQIVPQLARIYPDARFIHLVRDGRDVALSFRAAEWTSSSWLHGNAQEWIGAMEYHWRFARSELLRERILLVRYEDLVLRAEATLRRICRFIGEEFEPQMLSWRRMVDAQVPARERRQHAKLKLKIGEEGVARWKREISARGMFMCEAFMALHLKRLGYELRYPGPLWRPVFALTRFLTPAVLPIYEWAVRARCRKAGA
jgi:hypothetical protein